MWQEPLTRSEHLWSKAYDVFKTREPRLTNTYEQEVTSDGTTFSSRDQIREVIRLRLQGRETKQLIIKVFGKEIKVREYGEKLVKFVIWSRGFISSAVKTEPHAALAWAGISILLPLVLNSSLQNDAMIIGLEYISSLIQLYKIREEIYRKSTYQIDVEAAIIQLYSHIFQYQAQMICHLSRKSPLRALRNTMKVDRWDELLDVVKNAEKKVESYSALIDNVVEHERWEKHSFQMENSYKIEEQILQVLAEMKLEGRASREDDEERKLFQAFSSTYAEDKNFNPRRVPGTCDWFLQDKKFRNWRDAKTSHLLWVSAGPGCGKSVLSRCLIDERLVSTSVMSSTVCYFFFKDGQDGRQKAANALTAILHQLFTNNSDTVLVKHALQPFKRNGPNLCAMFGELWKILTEIASEPASGEVVCVIDALDECEWEDRRKLMDALVRFYSDSSLANHEHLRLKFLVTSRSYDDIETDFRPLSNVINFLRFDGDDKSDKISQEINIVIDHRVPVVAHKLSRHDQQAIAEHLKTMKNRTYLWLHLILDVISRKSSSHGTKRKIQGLIDQLPVSVNTAYEEILEKSSDQETAKILFEIIVAASRPLTVSEMNVALGLAREEGCTSYENLDLESDSDFRTSLGNICGLFVGVYDSRVYLIHQTAREFLLSIPNRRRDITTKWQHSLDIRDANSTLARICITLLSFQEFRGQMPWGQLGCNYWDWQRQYQIQVNVFRLLSYSATYWADHYKAIKDKSDSGVLSQVSEICRTSSGEFRTWYPIYCCNNSQHVSEDENDLTLLSMLGLYEVLLQRICGGTNVNVQGGRYRNALQAASAGGHKEVVQLLLSKGVDVNAEGGFYGNALQAASAGGHKKVVQLLLSKGADVNAEGGFYGNALQAASAGGHEKVVQLLLDKGADVNAEGGLYRNALRAASARGHEKVVQLLLDKGADVNAEGGGYGNALQVASNRDHEKVVQLLLDKGADVNAEGGGYGNALQTASAGGHEKVVQLLLNKGADVNAEGRDYGNALRAASTGGHERVVQLLLDKGADVNAKGGFYGNALQATSTRGHEKVIQLLLDKGADVNAKGGRYGNALQAASAEGHEKVVQLLLDKGADVNAEGGDYGNALQAASDEGHEKVVQLLLDKGADIGAKGGR